MLEGEKCFPGDLEPIECPVEWPQIRLGRVM